MDRVLVNLNFGNFQYFTMPTWEDVKPIIKDLKELFIELDNQIKDPTTSQERLLELYDIHSENWMVYLHLIKNYAPLLPVG